MRIWTHFLLLLCVATSLHVFWIAAATRADESIQDHRGSDIQKELNDLLIWSIGKLKPLFWERFGWTSKSCK